MKTRANNNIICSGSNSVPAGMNMEEQGVPGARIHGAMNCLLLEHRQAARILRSATRTVPSELDQSVYVLLRDDKCGHEPNLSVLVA